MTRPVTKCVQDSWQPKGEDCQTKRRIALRGSRVGGPRNGTSCSTLALLSWPQNSHNSICKGGHTLCVYQSCCAWLWDPSPAVALQEHPTHLLLDFSLSPGLGSLQTLLLLLLLHLGFLFPESAWQWQQETLKIGGGCHICFPALTVLGQAMARPLLRKLTPPPFPARALVLPPLLGDWGWGEGETVPALGSSGIPSKGHELIMSRGPGSKSPIPGH